MTDPSPLPLLSVCMIVKNEEPVIARALASAAGMGAELIVVDTGSTDRTVEIAREHGATVHHFSWVDDFSAARNFAFSKARGKWMLVLDADEEIQPELREHFERILTCARANIGLLRVPVLCINDTGGTQMTMLSARFVRNGHGYAYEGRVHEIMTANVLRAGGAIEDEPRLPIAHHGYTSAESARKDRQARNKKLIEAAHRAAPEDPRYWHYLGFEQKLEGDYTAASAMFDRVLAKAPNHDLAGWSASCLGAIHIAERDFGAAWHVLHGGRDGIVSRVNCIVQLGNLALREGDADTTRWCADELERNPEDDFTDRATGLERATELRSAAQVEKAANATQITAKMRASLLEAVAKYPRNTILAELLVRVCESIDGRGKGAIDAVRRSNSASAVISAAMTAFFRGGAYQQCVEMGEKSGVHNEMWAFALAKVGRADQAREELFTFGDNIAAHAIVFGLAYNDEAAIAHGLAACPANHRDACERVRKGQKVPAQHTWIATAWLELAISLREDDAATKIASALSWPIAERESFRALLTHDSVDPIAALNRALEHPTELASIEVIGLVAHAHGDYPAAATMLSMRAKAGDASVRVYLKAADAFAKMGRRQDAEALLAMGRESRPQSKALAAATAATSSKKKHKGTSLNAR